MADETTPQAAPPIPDSIPVDTDPSVPSIPIDLNPEYDPAKDKRPAFQKVNLNPTGPTIEAAPEPTLLERAKKVVTEGIPQFSTRTVENPKYGQQQFLAPEEALTPKEQRQAPVATGLLEEAGITSAPSTIAMLGAAGVFAEVPEGALWLTKVASALRAGLIGKGLYDQYPALMAANQKSQTAKTPEEREDAFAETQRILTHMGTDTVFGLLSAVHGASGLKDIIDSTTGSGVPDEGSTFKAPVAEPNAPKAPEPEETHPEMNRETVKSLRNLGYSNQHITNFNISEIRDILKNETPAADYKFPQAAPDPDKFADAGGKFVGQQPVSAAAETPATIEKPVEPVEKGAESADPVEDLLMSDKIKGKKVKGATPQTEPLVVGQTTLPRGLVERSTGDEKADAAIKTAGAIPAGNMAGLALFHDPKTQSTLALKAEDVTPEAVQQHLAASRKAFGLKPEPEALAESGGKFVGEQPTSAVKYHPDLQKVLDISGPLHKDAARLAEGPAFITPDGKISNLPAGAQHPDLIKQSKLDNGEPTDAGDTRPAFLDRTGAIRTRFFRSRAGDSLSVSVPRDGVTPEQVETIKRGVGKIGRNGNLTIERSDISRDNPNLAKTKEFATPSDVDSLLQAVGAHPDQQDIVSKELQSPHKESYGMEVTESDGTSHIEKVDAHSPKQALATTLKKFPEASGWRLANMPEEKAPATDYSVPKGKLHKMAESFDRPEVHTIRHELGHALVGLKEGLATKGMVSARYPDMPKSMRAGLLWSSEGLYTRDAEGRRQVRPEKRVAALQRMMGGIAADEVFNDVPRSANHNFPIDQGGDGEQAYKVLTAAGFNHEEAFEEMHKMIDAGVEYLQRPAVSVVIKENENFREQGLSRQFHYSPERLQQMHAEIQRRLTNEKQTSTGERNVETVGAGAAGNRSADVASGKGEVSPADKGLAQGEKEVTAWQPPAGIEKGISSSHPVDTNIPLVRLSVSPDAYAGASFDNALGRGSKTKGPIRVLYNPENGQYLVEDGMHRLVEAHQKGETEIPAKLWSGYSDTVANVHGDKMDLSPDTEEDGIVSEEKVKKAPKAAPEVSPNDKLQASAQKYAAANGMPEISHAPVQADPEHAKAIAKIYEESKHDPNDPRVKAAYAALKSETLAQFHHLRDDLGLKFKPQETDPYASAGEMMDDIKKNNRLKVFTGSSTGEDHPLSAIAPGTKGQTYNTIFRWVHDAMGHAAGGNDFSESGEKSATEAHAQMYSDTARPAMRNETEGQTSWFFHNPDVESGKAQPEKFADQKAALIHDGLAPTKGRGFVAVTPDEHQAAVSANPHGISMSDVSPEGTSYQMHQDGKPVQVFYAINPDGEISGIVNNTEGAVKNAAADVFKDAVAKGGTYLTAWDVNDKLPAIYRKQGFVETARTAYDAKTYGAPNQTLQASWKALGWNGKQPYPDVVKMEPTSWHEKASASAATNEAGGIDPRTGKSDTTGFGTEILPELRQPLDHAPTPEDFAKFYAKHQAIFDQYPELRVGWDNNSAVAGGHEINIGAVGPHAAKVAANLDQKSAFDIAKGEVIPTGGTGLKTEFKDYPLAQRIQDLKGENDHTVSTRIPTGKVKGKLVEDHTDQSRMSDMDAAKAAPDYVQKMVNRTNTTPGFTAPKGDAQAQADAYIRHTADNIKFVHDKITPEEFKRDEKWYPVGAHERGQAVAKQHGMTPHQVYAITAVESPMTDWDQNTSLAERTVNIWKNQQNTKFTPEMQDAADKITDLPANKSFKPFYKKLAGKTLAELPTTTLQAHWLRLYDEAHNPREYETWGPDGTSHGLAKNSDGSNANVGWSFQRHIEKAIEILKDGSDENISKQLGYGHKVRNFYNNQLAPDDPRFLTMDTHAINVAQLRPMSGKTQAVRENFGAIKNGPHGLKGTYPLHDAGYRLAAKELDIPIPGRLQSPTWVKIRDVFTDDFKTKDNQDAVDAIWKEHSDGKITANDARNRIWDYAVRWNRENAARTGAASNQGQLFETGVRGESAAGTAGRGDRGGATGEVPAQPVDEDTSFEFGENAPTARSRTSKVSDKQRAKNEAKVAGIVEAMRGLDKPGKK